MLKDEIYSEQLEELKNAIEGYKIGEYDESIGEIQHDDMIPVAYTTLGNKEEFEIQVTLNIAKKRLESLVTGAEIEEVEYRHYDHIWQITKEFEHVEFEDLIRLEELDMDEMLNKDKLLQLRRDPSFLQEMNDLGLDIDSHLIVDEYTVHDGKVSMVINEYDGLPNFYIDILPNGLEDEQAHRIFYEPTGDYILLVDKEVFDPAWKREGYSVERAESEPDSDGYSLDNFNVIQDDKVVATIYPNSIMEHNEIVSALDRGEDVNGWDNGMGEMININVERTRDNGQSEKKRKSNELER